MTGQATRPSAVDFFKGINMGSFARCTQEMVREECHLRPLTFAPIIRASVAQQTPNKFHSNRVRVGIGLLAEGVCKAPELSVFLA
jgi:hypothetical protein